MKTNIHQRINFASWAVDSPPFLRLRVQFNMRRGIGNYSEEITGRSLVRPWRSRYVPGKQHSIYGASAYPLGTPNHQK